jgi:ribosomal protein L30/L7E
MIIVVRIAGKVKQKKTVLETLKRLKLGKKYSATLIEKTDRVRIGMIESIDEAVMYGEVSDALVKELQEKRGKEGKKVFFLHPPRGGFKKSTKLAYPKGILGHNKDVAKYVEKML